MWNTVDNIVMYMIDKIKMEMEMDMEDETERVAERVLPITTEKIETPIEAPTSPVNEEVYNE